MDSRQYHMLEAIKKYDFENFLDYLMIYYSDHDWGLLPENVHILLSDAEDGEKSKVAYAIYIDLYNRTVMENRQLAAIKAKMAKAEKANQ